MSLDHSSAADTNAKEAVNDPNASNLPDTENLIEQLGDDNYATRVYARETLQRMGLEAFDQLLSAQHHPDSEIAMTARHLVSSLMVSWSKETDPETIREILHEYGAQSEDERRSRIEMLADLPSRVGLPALVRLARFETSLSLSRIAAISLMQQPVTEDADLRTHHAELVRSGLGDSGRTSVTWLTAYAEDLTSGTVDAAKWIDLIASERRKIDTVSTQRTTHASVLELARVTANRAWLNQQSDEAFKLIRRHLDLVPATTRDLSEACRWAIQTGLYPIVLDLRDLHPKLFETQPILMYSAAEALKTSGEDDQAEMLASRAIMIRPLPSDPKERDKMSPNELEEIAQAHREIAGQLRSRGLFDWAEREFRIVIDRLELDSAPAASARVKLAEMLGDLQKHQQLIDVLSPLVQRIEADDKLKTRLSTLRISYDLMRSNIQWHGALMKIEEGDIDAAKPMLEKGYRLYPFNIDILIAMFRLDTDDADWKAQVSQLLARSISESLQQINNIESLLRQPLQIVDGSDALAQAMNHYAWLVSNTEGDFERALRYSQQSLELMPNSPDLLDTLARCYFAVGDLENALRTQKKAVRLLPHSPPLQRQLQEFEQAFRSQQSQ